MNQSTNLYKALGIFIKEIRSVFHTMCLTKFGENWQVEYSETFRYDSQRDIWNTQIANGQNPQDLIDFGNLEMFAEKYKESGFFRNKFSGINFRVPTYFKDIAEARNMVAHHAVYDSDKSERAYLGMIGIAQTLVIQDLEDELRKLKEESFGSVEINKNTTKRAVQTKTGNKERLYDNKEIQIKITEKAQTLSDAELEKLCNKDYSKKILDINYALFVRVPKNASNEERQKAIKDHKDKNRWTVRYEFSKNGYSYFVTTQWYPRNDEYVKRWLNS